jgi:hypothetical protein
MARTLRKRKRDSEASSSDYDGDTIVVTPRQAPTARVLLRETQTGGNVGRRSRTASHVQGMYHATCERYRWLIARSSHTNTTGHGPTGTTTSFG